MRHDVKTHERGFALAATVITALLCAVAAYVVLLIATSQARRAKVFQERYAARYAAEAGLVWAKEQKLWTTPTWSSGAGADVTINGFNVDINLPPCTATPCEARKFEAKVVY